MPSICIACCLHVTWRSLLLSTHISTRRQKMPSTCRVLSSPVSGECVMTSGIPPRLYDIVEPVYDLLGVEPLVEMPGKTAPPAHVIFEYLVLREGSQITLKQRHVVYPCITGAFFVLKYVTDTRTSNRIQVDVPLYEHTSIVLALTTKYKGTCH